MATANDQEQPLPREHVQQLVFDLNNAEKREYALQILSKKRKVLPDLAPMLWIAGGVVVTILQEIITVYPLITPPALTAHASNRVCNALALLQCIAAHDVTRDHFLNTHMLLFLYPFLNTVTKTKSFEYLRLTSLGVIGALVKMDDPNVIKFLLQTEIIPLCLRIMETGSELSKTVATFIVHKILQDDLGLGYMCVTPERFHAVNTVLSKVINGLVYAPSARLFKHVVKCYLRIADHPKARIALCHCPPVALDDHTFANLLDDDPLTKNSLFQLYYQLNSCYSQLHSLPPM